VTVNAPFRHMITPGDHFGVARTSRGLPIWWV
jgi:hypothetical protein